jgi:transketolase
MSIVETLAVLYGKQLRVDPQRPHWDKRDWFILSKGHSGPAYFAALALKGFFDLSVLQTLNADDTILPSHPDSLKTPGVDCTTGSLGQGISQAVGVALALKHQQKPNRVYCIVGDGECNEGQVWEAFQSMVANRVDNLIVFIDNNKGQNDGATKTIHLELNFEPLMTGLGFYTQVVKGNEVLAIDEAIDNAKRTVGRPSVIILNTTKGQGLPFVEAMASNHHIAIDEDIKQRIMSALGAKEHA